MNIPCLSGRVQRSLEPAKVARLEFIIDADEGQFSTTVALVQPDGSMTAMVTLGNGNALGAKVH